MNAHDFVLYVFKNKLFPGRRKKPTLLYMKYSLGNRIFLGVFHGLIILFKLWYGRNSLCTLMLNINK